MGRAGRRNRIIKKKVWLSAWTQDKDGQSLEGDGTFWRSRSIGKATNKRWSQPFRRRLSEQKFWRKLDTGHQRREYYEHCSRSIVPQKLKEKQRYVCTSFLWVGGTRRSTFLGGKKRKNSGNIAVSIRTRKGNLAGRDKHDARLGRVVQGKKRGGGNPLFWAQRERNLL